MIELEVDGREAIAVTVDAGPANAGLVFEVPPTQQEVADCNFLGVVTAHRPGAALVTMRDPAQDGLVIDQQIALVRTSAQQQYLNDVRTGVRGVRTVFSPL